MSIFSDMITRGAGDRDSRALTLAMDSLGLDHSESVGQLHLRFWGSTLARSIPPCPGDFRRHPAPAASAGRRTRLRQGAGIARSASTGGRAAPQSDGRDAPPFLARAAWQGSPRHSGASIASRRKAFVRSTLRSRPHGDDHVGRRQHGMAGVERSSRKTVRRLERNDVKPPELIAPKRQRASRKGHDADADCHRLCSVPFGHPDYYAALGTCRSSPAAWATRLFTEVQQKRGLCYAVSANYQTFKQDAGRSLLRRYNHRTRPGNARRDDRRTEAFDRRRQRGGSAAITFTA